MSPGLTHQGSSLPGSAGYQWAASLLALCIYQKVCLARPLPLGQFLVIEGASLGTTIGTRLNNNGQSVIKKRTKETFIYLNRPLFQNDLFHFILL